MNAIHSPRKCIGIILWEISSLFISEAVLANIFELIFVTLLVLSGLVLQFIFTELSCGFVDCCILTLLVTLSYFLSQFIISLNF